MDPNEFAPTPLARNAPVLGSRAGLTTASPIGTKAGTSGSKRKVSTYAIWLPPSHGGTRAMNVALCRTFPPLASSSTKAAPVAVTPP